MSATGGLAKQATNYYKGLASLLADKWDQLHSVLAKVFHLVQPPSVSCTMHTWSQIFQGPRSQAITSGPRDCRGKPAATELIFPPCFIFFISFILIVHYLLIVTLICNQLYSSSKKKQPKAHGPCSEPPYSLTTAVYLSLYHYLGPYPCNSCAATASSCRTGPTALLSDPGGNSTLLVP